MIVEGTLRIGNTACALPSLRGGGVGEVVVAVWGVVMVVVVVVGMEGWWLGVLGSGTCVHSPRGCRGLRCSPWAEAEVLHVAVESLAGGTDV